MSQGGSRKKKAPVYSADSLALRIFFGVALAALGVVIFLAVDLNFNGQVFPQLRQVCFGLTGGLSYLLAILPIWAGALLIISSQRQAPVRPMLYFSLATNLILLILSFL